MKQSKFFIVSISFFLLLFIVNKKCYSFSEGEVVSVFGVGLFGRGVYTVKLGREIPPPPQSSVLDVAKYIGLWLDPPYWHGVVYDSSGLCMNDGSNGYECKYSIPCQTFGGPCEHDLPSIDAIPFPIYLDPSVDGQDLWPEIVCLGVHPCDEPDSKFICCSGGFYVDSIIDFKEVEFSATEEPSLLDAEFDYRMNDLPESIVFDNDRDSKKFLSIYLLDNEVVKSVLIEGTDQDSFSASYVCDQQNNCLVVVEFRATSLSEKTATLKIVTNKSEKIIDMVGFSDLSKVTRPAMCTKKTPHIDQILQDQREANKSFVIIQRKGSCFR